MFIIAISGQKSELLNNYLLLTIFVFAVSNCSLQSYEKTSEMQKESKLFFISECQ